MSRVVDFHTQRTSVLLPHQLLVKLELMNTWGLLFFHICCHKQNGLFFIQTHTFDVERKCFLFYFILLKNDKNALTTVQIDF